MTGKLFLLPVTLGSGEAGDVIPQSVLNLTSGLRVFVVEEIRSARRFLRSIDKSFPIDDTLFFELNEHTGDADISAFLKPALGGKDTGILSESGLPGIADPGSRLVRLAHNLGIKVVPMSGPSSIILGLVASGLNGQNFEFHGYLPVRNEERDRKLKEIEKTAGRGITGIFMETPYRAEKVFNAVLTHCSPETMVCVAADITLPSEYIRTMRVRDWKKNKPDLHNRLVVFLVGR